jgi:hypothetical protein
MPGEGRLPVKSFLRKLGVRRPEDHSRRNFFRSAAGVAGAAGMANLAIFNPQEVEAAMQNVNTRSKPSELKITDLRVAVVAGAPMTCPLIRIDTNQGVYGLGEVRDGAARIRADAEEPHSRARIPATSTRSFRKIKQFGGHARQGGGVCGVEMALWDLAGKAYNVPAYQMLGGKFRDRVRLYADTDPCRAIRRSSPSA